MRLKISGRMPCALPSFVYVSLARVILIASGLVLLGSILLLHLLRLLRPLPAATITSQRSLSTHPMLNRLTGHGSAEIIWHLASSFALLCLVLHLGRKFDLLNQPPTYWLRVTLRFKVLLHWCECTHTYAFHTHTHVCMCM